MRSFFALVLLALLFVPSVGSAQEASFKPNYDETQVPVYDLPNPLVMNNGKKVKNNRQWVEDRRPEILELFTKEVYGRAPTRTLEISFRQRSIDDHALNGKAIRQEIRISFTSDPKGPGIDLLIYKPKTGNEEPIPIFLGLNFYGNHTVHPDEGITITDSWVRNNKAYGIYNNRATSESRGVRQHRWAIEQILEGGYALATMYYGDIDPDYHDEFNNGVHAFFKGSEGAEPGPEDWGSIATWAWGLSRALDYLETDPTIDHRKVIVMGHSRLGKTALWAGAIDQRFAMAISNNSGCGGAALSRRRFGETVGRINQSFPHWFCDNFNKYNNNEDALPVDQHMLIALMAPRPVYVASAEEDRWADPKGEFLSAYHAGKVYRLLGLDGLPAKKMPAVGQPVSGTIGYHIRPGKHDVTLYDWEQYLNFADKHLKKD
jgi:hypothetical protein